MNTIKRNDTPVIAIGASAGALSAFERFFSTVPDKIPAAVVIIQHLDPKHDSILNELVGKFTVIKTEKITSDTIIKPNKVFVIPNNKDITLKGGKFILHDRDKKSGNHFPIDRFFSSLKKEYGSRAIGVILSGAGSDGSTGITEIKEGGGFTVVQEPSTAEYNGMPGSAIDTGMADFIAPPEKMYEKIADYIDCEFREKKLINFDDPQTMNLLNEIFHLIKKLNGHDFSEYKKSTICRRIERRMLAVKTNSLNDYIEFLKNKPQEINVLFKELLINVTSFFRNKDTFEYIQNKVIPEIADSSNDNKIRIWVPACSTGEEAYSWAILLRKYTEENHIYPDIQIFASDIDTPDLEKAREGRYPLSISENVPEDILEEYFIEHKDFYEVKKSLRELIIFAEHNILQDPPYSKIDAVSCRNFLIYLDNKLQQKAISVFHYSLKTGAFLVLGDSESLGVSAKYFTTSDKKHKIFKKIESGTAGIRIWDSTKYNTARAGSAKKITSELSLSEIAKQSILDNFSPSGVVINYNSDILYVQGRTGKYIELSTGQATYNILNTAREGLRMPLTNAILKAKSTMKEVEHKRIRVKTNGDYELVDLIVQPIKTPDSSSEFLLVVFRESCGMSNIPGDETGSIDSSKTISQLHKELRDTSEHLQSTIEELESTNEELKSANEEAQSTNEELQSSNEELETSQEELQSLNEELLTTNYELQYKVKELTDINNDIKNLLESTNIATIFLDKHLKIFRFTPSILAVFDLLETDIGRSINPFVNNLDNTDIIKDAKEVLRTLIPIEKEVQIKTGNYYWMRMLPYRTIEDKIEGVVITFTDITVRKQQEIELDKYRNHLEELVKEKTIEAMQNEEKFRVYIKNSPTGVFVVNGKGEYTYVNEAGLQLLGYTLNELAGMSVKDVNKEGNLRSFEKIKALGKVSGIETEWKRKDGSLVPVLFDAVKVSDDEIIAFGKNITDMKQAESKLKFEKYRAQHYLDIAGVMFIKINKEGIVTLVNRKACSITGYNEDELTGKNWFDNFIPDKDKKKIKQVFSRILRGEAESIDHYINPILTKSGEEKMIAWNNSMLLDENGQTIGILSSGEDITERVKAEQELKHLFKSMINAFVLFESVFDNNGKFISYRFVYINDAYEKITGVKNDEVKGKTVHEVWPETEPEWIKRYGRVAVTGNSETFDLYHDPTHKLYHCNVYRPWNNDKRFCVIFEDITDRKEKEKALRERELRYRSLFEQAAVGVARVAPNGKWLEVNQKLCDIVGYNKSELLKKTFQDITYKDDLEIDLENVNKMLSGIISTYSMDKRYIRKDGTLVWINLTVSLVKDENNMPDYFISVIKDISVTKKLEDILKESEEKYRLLVENQSDMIVKVDNEGRYLFVSGSYCRMFGKTEAQLLGKKFMPLVHKDDRKITEEEMKKLSKPPYTCYIEQRAKTVDGWKWLSWQDTAVVDDKGNIVSIIGVGRDIDDKKKAELALEADKEKFKFTLHNKRGEK